MAYTQAQMLQELRDNLGDINSNERTDYQLIGALRRAYATAWPDWYQEVKDYGTYTGYASLPAGTLHVDVPPAFVGGAIYSIFGRTNRFQRGTAFTVVSGSSTIYTATAHGLVNNQQVQVDGGSLPVGLSSATPYQVETQAFPAVAAGYTSGSATFTSTPGPHTFQVGLPVTISPTVPTGFTANTTYYVASVPTSTTFTLSATRGGAAITAQSTGSSNLVAPVTSLVFQLSTTSDSTGIITPTSAGSGYVGTYVDPTTDYKPFNQWTRGLRIDSLTTTNPRIRFTSRDMTTFELKIDGAAQLNYPYVTVSVAGTATFTVVSTSTGSTLGTTYTPTNGDTVYFWAAAPNSFNSGGTGSGGLTPYYIVNATSTTFQLASTAGGAAITTTSTNVFNIYPGSQVLTGTDYSWFSTFLLWQGEVFARAGLQRSGNLDRRGQAQRRLLAQQEADKCRSHRMQPAQDTDFAWNG